MQLYIKFCFFSTVYLSILQMKTKGGKSNDFLNAWYKYIGIYFFIIYIYIQYIQLCYNASSNNFICSSTKPTIIRSVCWLFNMPNALSRTIDYIWLCETIICCCCCCLCYLIVCGKFFKKKTFHWIWLCLKRTFYMEHFAFVCVFHWNK